MADSNSSSGGISFATVLFLVFLILKLTKTIDWSWWWVTSPLWISAGLAVLVIILAAVFVAVLKD